MEEIQEYNYPIHCFYHLFIPAFTELHTDELSIPIIGPIAFPNLALGTERMDNLVVLVNRNARCIG